MGNYHNYKMRYISKLSILKDYIIIGCDNGKGVFVFEKTTGTITKIDFDFGHYIGDIISLGNNMMAIVSTMKDSEPRVNIFGVSKTAPHHHLFSLESEPSSQETSAAINSNKSIFVSGSYTRNLSSYSMNTDRTFTRLHSIIVPTCSCSGIRVVKFHPEIQNLLFVAVGNTIFQYKVSDSGKFEFLAELSGHPDWINSLEFSPDGTIMASGSYNLEKKDTLIVWNINGFEPAVLSQSLQGHTTPVNSVAFSPDGTVLASGSVDQTIRIWKKEGKEWICKQVLGEPNSGPNYNFINQVVFDPTDPTLLISGSSTGQVVFWRLSGGEWRLKSEIVI
jgi:WD40 repeat protein